MNRTFDADDQEEKHFIRELSLIWLLWSVVPKEILAG